MDTQLIIICALTFVIHVIATLAYAVRIAGVRTRRIAVSFALFGIIALVSRTANSFQGPFLAKRVEEDLAGHVQAGMLGDFRLFLLAATLATIVGAFLIPSFQRYFSRAVIHFQAHRSIPRLALHAFSRGGIAYIRGGARLPARQNVTQLAADAGVSWKVITLNVLAMSLWTVGVFASLYAGFLKPELRVTCANLSSVINGFATIVLTVIIDPQISVMTDDVMEGRVTENRFRRAITTLIGARVVGTLLAQLMLVPAAFLIVRVAEAI
ncbi:lipid II flippase Amj family protein [Paraburkholderia bryophila]|uniref:lipid II flippase Amj family protein n=1 Tax=Paraburkholderia bryophila TaxID=420952 RepID=UPI00234983E1|nr:lipid II flippase Amj family protein [Paraburkholderia bryophila]WCM24324.1 lipid II flippase Amj family protein [Paraburkholderia bryophila]